METIYTISATGFLFVVLVSIAIYYFNSGNIFNPWFIITSLSILDVYIPAILRLLDREFNIYPSWMEYLDGSDLIVGTMVYFIGWFFFSIGYFFQKN